MGLKHLTLDVRHMLGAITTTDQNNYPEMLGHTCIINAPGVFKVVWNTFVKPYLDVRTQGKVEVEAPTVSLGQVSELGRPFHSRMTICINPLCCWNFF